MVQVFTSEQSWQHAAIFQGNHRLAFKEVILDIRCVRLFYYSTGHHIGVQTWATIWRQDALDALMNAAELRHRLEDLHARPALGVEKRLVAQHLLQRQNSTLGCNFLDNFRVKIEFPVFEQRHIVRGSFGAVSVVNWMGITCAKKHFHGPKDEDSVEEFLKEVSIMAKMNHPHIVKLLCVSEQPGVYFLMELLPMNLSEFIKKRWQENPDAGIMPTAAVDIMLQMARGLEYIHAHDIVHRDVKSCNVLVTPSGMRHLRNEAYAYVKLIDFRLAKIKAQELANPTREMMGTSRWRAPEAFGKDQPIDWKKADAYSFAMLCSEILTRGAPFASRGVCELYTAITSGERPELRSSCPEVLASLLKACGDSHPSVRPTFTEIREDLITVKNGLLKFRWDGSDLALVAQKKSNSGQEASVNRECVEGGLVAQLSVSGLRILSSAVLSPQFLRLRGLAVES